MITLHSSEWHSKFLSYFVYWIFLDIVFLSRNLPILFERKNPLISLFWNAMVFGCAKWAFVLHYIICYNHFILGRSGCMFLSLFWLSMWTRNKPSFLLIIVWFQSRVVVYWLYHFLILVDICSSSLHEN